MTKPTASEAFLLKLVGEAPCGSLTLRLSGGGVVTHTGTLPGPKAMITFHQPDAGRRIAAHGSVGFGEAYMDGAWSTPDLTRLIYYFLLNMDTLAARLAGRWWWRVLELMRSRRRRNTRAGSARNITYHYDLGNTFYAAWLDEGMTYSSALFAHEDDALTLAQTRKYQRILDQLENVVPGQRLLEIGCGWGGFLELAAAKTPLDLTGVTISPAQHQYASQRLRGKARVERCDYRDITGRYEHIVSIEMLEAVGQEYWPVYFARLKELLKPGGTVVLQVITIADAEFARYADSVDFIRKYIFPGGMLPSLFHLRREAEAAYFTVSDVFSFGKDYAETLRRWRERFDAAWPAIAGTTGLDERFQRLWRYYLASCEAGFLAGRIDVHQVTLRHAS